MSEPIKVTWKDVLGYAGNYQVSDTGLVRSVPHEVQTANRWGGVHTTKRKGKVLRLIIDNDGYPNVKLCRDGVVRNKRVSRLVLEAFRSVPLEGMEAGHKDDCRVNNELHNLAWVSRLENEQEKTQRRRRPRTTVSGFGVVDVLSIREMAAAGFAGTAIAAMYGCHCSTVHLIIKERTWKSL